jgi:predicted membrane channel-forming protein YqfA (hemolysin III family)
MTFIALGLSSVFPVVHIIISKGLARAREEAAVDWLAGGGLW